MKISTGIVAGLLMAGIVISGCSEGANPVTGTPLSKPENASETAQSIGITFNGVGESIELPAGDVTWEFDPNCAREFFHVVGTTGSPSPNAGQQGAAITQVVMDNRCAFFEGGTLVGGTVNFGTKSVTVAPKNTTTYPADVPAGQCWTMDGEEVTETVDFQADIAGESLVMRNSGNDFWEKKFSFSLIDAEEGSRVHDVVYTLEEWDGTTWQTVETVNVGTVTDITSGEWDHMYIANAGTFGDVISHLVSGYTIGAIIDDEGGISGDNHENNNSTNSPDSDDNAEVAHGPTHSFTFSEAGSYRIRVNATVKGNAGVATHSITVTGGGGEVFGAPNCD